jgi:two-component system phosphate regulon sensor histidine kinase PhoR
VAETARPLRTWRDVYTSKVRLAVVLVLCFAVLPALLLLAVGVLVLVFQQRVTDIVFGILVLSFAATLFAGVTYTFLYVRRATSLARLQTEFVQKVSHDLRTPLTSIRMFVETLQSGRLSASESKEALDVLSTETARLSGLVERLLKWASMEAGKRIYERRHVPASTVIESALQAVEPQIKLARLKGSVDVEREIADELPEIEVDPDAVSEAIINVLQNALRYTPAAKHLRIRAIRVDGEIEISVTDNGPGIPKHEQCYIFEQFYRVVDPALPNVEGTGLGLSMVHHIIAAHGGRVTVSSESGKGATFRIALPVANA